MRKLTTKELSPRELSVIKLILKELTAQEIGERLGISSKTVEQHRMHIYQKTKTKSGIGLLRYALKNEIVKR